MIRTESGGAGGNPAPNPGEVRVSVLLPLPLDRAYDYSVPSGLELAPGDMVRVPLGSREVLGVVWEPARDSGLIPPARLKPVAERCDVPPMTRVQRRFIEWLADYNMVPWGVVLRMALSSRGALEPPKGVTVFRLAAAETDLSGLRLTPARRRVLAVLGEGPARPARDLAQAAGVGPSVIKGLAKLGAIEPVDLPPLPAFATPDWRRPGATLSPAQSEAATALVAAVRRSVALADDEGEEGDAAGFSVTLLDGVTGAGKTEVYLEAVAAALEAGRQVLVLLPEIALTAQWLERFRRRFGVAPTAWHSDLSQRERRIAWRGVAEGEARVVVGARSALFLPYRDLGLIVVDEEHDLAFKQEDGVTYHARDMAIVRARLGRIPIVLVSATPSLETVTNVETGRFDRLHLPERHGAAVVPRVELVDLRSDPPPRLPGLGPAWLSATLRQTLGETFAAGEQALLFLNRRGYAPLTLCRTCGHRLACPHCTAWLVAHRLAGRLQCHHCGHGAKMPSACPECGTEGSLAACGPGVERLLEEVTALFPDQRTRIVSSDTLTGPAAAAEFVRAMGAREIDLVIGTQVMAKGHHFPWLTLVGVVDGDLGLAGGDLRAAERTFQLLHQVAGRAGRAERRGRALVQTYDPEHPVMQALATGERDRFLATEAENRRAAGMPPFSRLAALVLSCRDESLLERTCGALARAAPRGKGLEVLGPAPAPLAVLRRQHRRRFLLRAARSRQVQPIIAGWLDQVDLPAAVHLKIDIDPYSFL